MPTVFMMEKPCYVCGNEQQLPDIGGAAAYHGPRDLDTRPSISQRSSIYMWVQRCHSCGYCAPDIAKGDPSVKEVVASKAYQTQLGNPDFSETANSFLCRSLIMEHQGDYVEAGWSCVYAAWVCDDSGFDRSGRICRERALQWFQRAQQEKMPFGLNRSQEMVLMVDLLRRARRFDEARNLAEVELSLEPDERTTALLTFETDLVEEKDSRLHTESEGLEE